VVGKALTEDGFFTDRGADVVLAKDNGKPVISFLVQDGVWNQPNNVASFEEIGREVAPLVGGLPVKVRLLDTMRVVKKEVTVGNAEFPGNDDVYYRGGVTQAEAQAGGEALKTADFFEGEGVDVFVSKDDGTATIGFVTSSKAWSDPVMGSDFEMLARAAAPALGGPPIRLQLIDNKLVVKKEVMVAAAN
jgi:hypothetical protein